MYDHIYECMVDAKIASKGEKEVMYNKHGNVVTDIQNMYGRPTKYHLEHQEMLIFVDETGGNTSQIADGNIGGRKVIVPTKGSCHGTVGSTTDHHFTVLPFISGTGSAVMCAIILQSEKKVGEIPWAWRLGIDILHDFKNGPESEMFVNNFFQNDTQLQGGPRCKYNGEEIPYFVCASPKSSISSELLKDMLEALDTHCKFDRTNGKKPFLLLDGHQSRFDIPFLDYIHGSGHEWVSCFGVPYGTHIWQVADSPQLNGLFKSMLARLKQLYFSKRSTLGQQSFEMSDIVPLVRRAWEQSFAIQTNAKKAIAERGWGPLNYVCLDHPDVRKTVKANGEAVSSGSGTTNLVIDVSSFNSESGYAGAITESIIALHLKDDKRKQTLLEKKTKIDTIRDDAEKIKALCKSIPSSGVLGGVGYFSFSKSLSAVVQGEKKRKQEEEAMKIQTKKKKSSINVGKYLSARTKVLTNKLPLTVAEYKALIKYHKKKNEPNIPSKLTDLQITWTAIQHRLHEDPVPTHESFQIIPVFVPQPTIQPICNSTDIELHEI